MNFVKKYSGLIAIIALVFIVAFFIQKIKVNKLSQQTQIQAVELAQLKDTVFTYTTKNGQLISKINSVEVERSNLKEALEIVGIDRNNLKDQNIKLRNVISVLQLEIKTLGEGQTNVIDTFYIVENTTDTIYYQKVSDWTDSYLSLFNAKIENKKLDFKYNYFLDMDLIVDKPKNAIIVTAKINNPNIESFKARSITVSTKRKWYEKPWVWGIAGMTTGILITK